MDLSHPTYQQLRPDQDVENSSEILACSAGHSPDKTGLIDGDRQWTFSELDRLANRFANAILSRFDVQPGPIGIIGKNSAEYIIAHFGTARTGRYSINFPTRCTVQDLVDATRRTAPVAIVADTAVLEMVNEACSRIDNPPVLIAIDPANDTGAGHFWKFIDGHADAPPDVTIDADGPGSVIFTGGTTGKPKAVLSSQRARAISAMAAIEDFRIREDLIAGYSVPFTHTAGLFSWFQPAVLAGCTGVVIPKWEPELFMQLTETHGINVIFAVPSQLATLLDHPSFQPQRLKTLKMIAFGGAPLNRTLIERAEQAMPWLECARAYGSTETGHLAAQMKQDREFIYDGYNQPGGRLEIEIFKEPGVIAAEGETGEIATRGKHLMSHYIDDDDANMAFFKTDCSNGEWGWMGDLAVKHRGYFSIVGRSKHMILSGGLNIYPAELENILISHPSVADCVVFGIEDPTWGELPAAAIVSRDSVFNADAVMDYVGTRVARYKRLRRIYVVEAIPRTVAGKVQVELIRGQCLASEQENTDSPS